MRIMKCEICGDNNIVKQDGLYVCQCCGTKYTLEEARNLFSHYEDQPESGNKTDRVMEEKTIEKNTLDAARNDQESNVIAYLKPLIKLESSIVEQDMLIDKYREIREKKKPVFTKIEHLPYPPFKDQVKYDQGKGGVVVALIGGIIMAALIVLSGSADFILLWLIMFAILIPLLLYFAYYANKKAEYDESKKKIDVINLAKDAENKKSEERYNISIAEWNEKTSKDIAYMNRPLVQTKETLDKLYSVDYIHPKYRNLPALTSIYEYLSTGRCQGLTGPDGAYNLYEDELRKDTIISQLNTIIDSLEQIKRNQFMLYQELRGLLEHSRIIVRELESIRAETQAIAELTVLNTYYNEIAAANSSALLLYESIR